MAILTLQKRARSLGRIRIGQVVPTSNGKTRPEKLDRFRLTSASKDLLDKAAALYGGEVREWTPQGGGAKQWEVITTSTRLPIMVPPQPVSQFLETWAGGICVHRCDGYTEMLSGEPCDPEDDRHIDARPTTRLNVVLRDVEGIGVWRLETKGWNAAVELPDAAEFLAQAGGYVNGWLSLEERVSKTIVNDKPQTRRFMVPIIEIDVTPAELMAGKGRVQAPSVEGPVPQKAIESTSSDRVEPPRDEDLDRLDLDGLRDVWNFFHERGQLDEENLRERILTRVKQKQAAESPPADEPVDAELVDDGDADAVWNQILAAAGLLTTPMTTSQVQDDFAQRYGMAAAVASAAELRVYLEHLKGAVPA